MPFGRRQQCPAVEGAHSPVGHGSNNCCRPWWSGQELRRARRPWGRFARRSRPQLDADGVASRGMSALGNSEKLYVGNMKGHGSLNERRARRKRLGTPTITSARFSITNCPTPKQLEAYTEEVNANNRLAQSLQGLEPRPGVNRPGAAAPWRNRPSFEHVRYIIKKTDLTIRCRRHQGTAMAIRTVMFGEKGHAQTTRPGPQFTAVRQFLCQQAVLSAAAITWVNTPKSPSTSNAPLAASRAAIRTRGATDRISSDRSLWDTALCTRKNVQQLGEQLKDNLLPGQEATWRQVYADYQTATSKVKIAVQAQHGQPERLLAPPAIRGFPLTTPDVYRASCFREEFRVLEKKGTLPNLLMSLAVRPHQRQPARLAEAGRWWPIDNDVAVGQNRSRGGGGKSKSGRRPALHSRGRYAKMASITWTVIAPWPCSSSPLQQSANSSTAPTTIASMGQRRSSCAGHPPMK